LRAGRQQDRLTFGDQEDIAQELGFVDGVTLGVEQFMQAYYRHARIVALTAERMLERARPRDRTRATTFRKLAHGIVLADGTITLENPQRLEADPALAFRFYRQALRHQKRPDYSALDAIARIAPDKRWRLRLQDSEEATQLFLDLLKKIEESPFRSGSTIAELHEVGLVSAMVPEFEPLVGRVYHDVFHVYTADIHAIKALERLQELTRGDACPLGLPSRPRGDFRCSWQCCCIPSAGPVDAIRKRPAPALRRVWPSGWASQQSMRSTWGGSSVSKNRCTVGLRSATFMTPKV
ncbi:MAG: hypothetical protein JRJ10_04765, partial [Deltaproteobacteria bacterium]|nr:hypothetical protein [Deltaproteobacteria bacterium]